MFRTSVLETIADHSLDYHAVKNGTSTTNVIKTTAKSTSRPASYLTTSMSKGARSDNCQLFSGCWREAAIIFATSRMSVTLTFEEET